MTQWKHGQKTQTAFSKLLTSIWEYAWLLVTVIIGKMQIKSTMNIYNITLYILILYILCNIYMTIVLFYIVYWLVIYNIY